MGPWHNCPMYPNNACSKHVGQAVGACCQLLSKVTHMPFVPTWLSGPAWPKATVPQAGLDSPSGAPLVLLSYCCLPPCHCSCTVGSIQVSRLLLLAASNPYGCWVESSRDRPCVMAVLASLPAAQKVSADCIAAAVRCGIEARTWEHLAPLLELPNAKRINSWALCDLLLEAAHANLMRLFSRLSR